MLTIRNVETHGTDRLVIHCNDRKVSLVNAERQLGAIARHLKIEIEFISADMTVICY